MRSKRRVRGIGGRLSILVASTLAVVPAGRAADIVGIGAGSGRTFTSALGLSRNGEVVVGYADGLDGFDEAFRWTAAGGLELLGKPPDCYHSYGFSVSDDGAVVAGFGQMISGDERGFRWTPADGLEPLGALPAYSNSVAMAVSASGLAIAGGNNEAFRWTDAAGLEGLGSLPGVSLGGRAMGISADGSVVVGHGEGALGREAFRWTATGGMIGLGDLAGGMYWSEAHGVSPDGDVVVGTSWTDTGRRAFRWTAESGLQALGTMSNGYAQTAYSASEGGGVIVGTARANESSLAFLWTEADGVRLLQDVLASQGVDLAAAGWTHLIEARAVSADGRTIVGTGTHSSTSWEAFIVHLDAIPEPGTAVVFGMGCVVLALRRGVRGRPVRGG